MDIRKTYRMQQQYYNGFSFLPIPALKTHNNFVYKLYAGEQNLYPLFDCVLNKEVLDNYYIVSIRKAITKEAMPLAHAVKGDLEYAADAVALFFRETAEDHSELSYAESTLRILQRSLDNFEEVQQRLSNDLQQLLSGHEFTSLYKTCSEDVANIIDVLNQVVDGIERNGVRLKDFTSQLPFTGKHKKPGLLARYCVNNLVEGLRKWCGVQDAIIHQLEAWRAIRVLHERQELLN